MGSKQMVPLSELCISCKCTVCKIYSKLQTRKFSRLFCSHDKTHLLSISLGRSRLVTGGGHYRESPPLPEQHTRLTVAFST